MADRLSRNWFSVSPRTLKTENACPDRKTAKAAARCPHTGQELRRVTEPPRGLSELISVPYGLGLNRSTANSENSLLSRTVERQNGLHLSSGKCRELWRTVTHTIGHRIADTVERIGPHSKGREQHRTVRVGNWRLAQNRPGSPDCHNPSQYGFPIAEP